jgi:hypothetical protein
VFDMSIYRETGTIEGCSPAVEAVERLTEFYLANGYDAVEPPPLEGSKVEAHKFERGKPGAGWWTSNMTELHTVVVLESAGERIQITYEVDTTGQMLKDVEQAFWLRELQWARRYATEETDEPRDLREDEARRAKKQTSEMRSLGVWAAVAIFAVIVGLGFLGLI